MAHPTPDVLALIALGEDVDAGVLEHVAACRACFAEIQGLQQVVAIGRSLGPGDRLVAPHPRVWQRIASDVNDGRVIPLPGAITLRQQAPTVAPSAPEPAPLDDVPTAEAEHAGRRKRTAPRLRWSTVALAAVVALIAGLGGGFALKGMVDPTPDIVSATQLNALPRWPGATGTASVEKGPQGQRTLVVTMEMPGVAPVKGSLEVWMSDTRAMDMVPMGTMSGSTGRFPIATNMDLASHPIIDVSLEPVGDTNPAHSDDSVVRGRLAL